MKRLMNIGNWGIEMNIEEIKEMMTEYKKIKSWKTVQGREEWSEDQTKQYEKQFEGTIHSLLSIINQAEKALDEIIDITDGIEATPESIIDKLAKTALQAIRGSE
jgi:molecular chaperone GrpE (heat shock protein)